MNCKDKLVKLMIIFLCEAILSPFSRNEKTAPHYRDAASYSFNSSIHFSLAKSGYDSASCAVGKPEMSTSSGKQRAREVTREKEGS